MSEKLSQILERFKSKLNYRNMDRDALDMSRAAASGNFFEGDKNYTQWALITNDPHVIINYVKSFVTTISSKLASAPLRPAQDDLNQTAIEMRLNPLAVELYKATLNDGYAFLGLGRADGNPTCSIIDARSIMYNGNDPTLKDATEIVVFDVLPRTRDDNFISEFPVDYVDFDPDEEKVRTSYYYFKNGVVNLDVYEEGVPKPNHYELAGLDRLPVIRFYGEKFELSDKRWHYRGLYYQFATIIKAATLTATKIQVRNALSDDDNWMVANDALANFKSSWRNSGVKVYDHRDTNNEQIDTPVIPIAHDNGFLIQSMELWKSIISDMLGPVVQSSSEAITREEVVARNEVRDAIANTYLSYIADAMSETYRVINMLKGGSSAKVVVEGGFLEEAQRSKKTQEILTMYQLAKDSGLNAQGFTMQVLVNSSLDTPTKNALGTILLQDPFASPLVKQLNGQIQLLTKQLADAQQREAILRTMASQRLERQAEWVAAQKEIKRNELVYKQWQQENKDTQEARMELMRQFLQQGNTAAALALLEQIKQTEQPIATDPALDAMGNTDLNTMSNKINEDIANVGNIGANSGSNPIQQPQGPAVQPQYGNAGSGQFGPSGVISVPVTNPARPGPKQP